MTTPQGPKPGIDDETLTSEGDDNEVPYAPNNPGTPSEDHERPAAAPEGNPLSYPAEDEVGED